MSTADRTQRLRDEHEVLRHLKAASSLFDFETSGNPPDRYTLIFRGKGITRGTSSKAEIETVELHRCDVRLPYSYPDRPPDIRWLTPIFHPNVSFSGYVDVKDIGLPWDKNLALDVVCERLWDMARLAYVDLDKASNYAAKNWFEDHGELERPVDLRPLRDRESSSGANVVRYQRRGAPRAARPQAPAAGGVLYIGEDTPVPASPASTSAAPRRRQAAPRPRTSGAGDDDILFIE
jgi:ubiquitin-protein ligase